jgi:hypothetical protein
MKKIFLLVVLVVLVFSGCNLLYSAYYTIEVETETSCIVYFNQAGSHAGFEVEMVGGETFSLYTQYNYYAEILEGNCIVYVDGKVFDISEMIHK